MKILVLGAGVVGTTTAYFLAKDGHEVTVLDRQTGPGLETSFANGGQISAGHAKPWAEPRMPLQALLWTFQADAPLLFRPWRWDPSLWSWGLKFLRNCTNERTRINMDRTLRVALYSRSVLKALRQHTRVKYNQTTKGILHIYRTGEEFKRGRAAAEKLSALGLPQDILTVNDCVKLEPALNHAASIDLAGGILSNDDESGDAHLFTKEIAKLAVELGVEFRFDSTIENLKTSGQRISGIITNQGQLAADAFVLALGSYTPHLTEPLGLKLPIYPAKGYSISIELKNPDNAPTISVTDENRFMVFSRLGNVLRVAGTAELAGWDSALREVRVEALKRNAQYLFPDASSYADLSPWCGLRAATPDSVPILGETPYENLFLNTGHGTLGWTMACGSARVIADLISGREPEIDLSGLTIKRFASS
ncbi:MAG: amino acid dehydrogenase [Candidatus Marinimicrobia bacterium]|nr:amino acid dehydrogenase [Candidatus Neomarinimicrobiota bacterium]